MLLTITNDGPEITSTNYWSTEYAHHGIIYLSINAGAFRLLLPRDHQDMLAEMRTANEVIISRGPYPHARRDDALEILFEDGSESPFSAHLGLEQVDRLPEDADQVRIWSFTAWCAGTDGAPKKALYLPAHYRRVPQIPYLKPWSERE